MTLSAASSVRAAEFDTEDYMCPDVGTIEETSIESIQIIDSNMAWILSKIEIPQTNLARQVKVRSAVFALPPCPMMTSLFP